EPRAAAKPAPDFDVVPPAMAPAAAEAPKPVDPASATVATLAGAAAGGAAGAAAVPKRPPGAPKQLIPPPPPAPPAAGRAAAPTAKPAKDQARRRAVSSYPKHGPLKLIGMVFGGWRN